jgi:quercetin dioxygenase-like cupin family protein
MAQETMHLEVRSTNQPDEVRPFEDGMGQAEVINLDGGIVVLKGTFRPGWRWSSHVKPIAGTDSCQAHHIGYVLQGQMTVRMDNGDESTFRAGDVFHIPPGHDAWVDGDEDMVSVDWGGSADYAKRH